MASAPHLVVVPHTHWDREWYRTHEEFRYRLVRLLDGLLDLLERDPAFRHFTLDGQVVVLDDYLEVRPRARERVAKLVREGRLCIGPWYVLPDEWLVSGEALVRNLRLGIERAAELGGAMNVGYVPDQFGHVGQLPQLFRGFGFDGAVLWRGVGDDVGEAAFTWEAPDGSALLTLYLVRGYGNAAHLPLAPEPLAARLAAELEALAPFARGATRLLMNGSDHLPPQPGLPAALAAAAGRLGGATVEIGTLPAALERVRQEATSGLPRHRGELRSGLRAPLLPGCASTRAPQKRADFRNDRLLTAWLEPLAAWLGALGGDADPEVIGLAWRVALENHPHDSICGCSIDAVHAAMDERFARVAAIAGSHLRHVTSELGRLVAEPPGSERAGDARVAVWNPHGSGRGQAEGVLELDLPERGRGAPALCAEAADGRRLPVHAERLEPGRVYADHAAPASVVAVFARGFPSEFFGQYARELRLVQQSDALLAEVILSDDPAELDFPRARDAWAEAIAAAGDAPARFRVRRRPRVRARLVDDFPGCGLRVYRLRRGGAGAGAVTSRAAGRGGALLENETWRVEVSPDGRVRCEHRPSGTAVEDAVRLVSEADRGDEYNFDPLPGDVPVERPERVRVRRVAASAAEAAVEIDARYRVPEGLAPERDRRSARSRRLRARIRLRLAAGLDRVDLSVRVDNTARDHRLRVLVRAPFRAEAFAVESAFEVAERPIEPAPDAFGSGSPAERPIGACPQRRFATLRAGARAVTLANRGSAEVEALRESDGTTSLAVTALRAVGWLSRADLALRPGHAGPPLETPGAQVPGIHEVELSWRWHGRADADAVAAAHGFAAPPLLFPAAGAPGGPLRDGARLLELDDPAVVVSAIEPRAGSAPLVRLYNTGASARSVRIRWHGPGAGALGRVDLAGRPLPGEPRAGGGGPERVLALGPHEIANLRPR